MQEIFKYFGQVEILFELQAVFLAHLNQRNVVHVCNMAHGPLVIVTLQLSYLLPCTCRNNVIYVD